MNRSRIVILLVVKSFFSLIALVLLTIVIHEGCPGVWAEKESKKALLLPILLKKLRVRN